MAAPSAGDPPAEPGSAAAEAAVRVLYTTHTLCSQCLVAKGRPPRWLVAQVVEEGGCVYLVAECRHHGPRRALYASDAVFFQEALRYAAPEAPAPAPPPPADGAAASPGGLRDIEDLVRRMQLTSPSDPLPLVYSVELHRDGAFVPDAVVHRKLEVFTGLLRRQPDANLFLKLTAMLSPNTEALNRKATFAMERVPPGTPVLIESSSDRLAALMQHPQSALRHPLAFPAPRLCVQAGGEAEGEQELGRLCDALRGVPGVSTWVTVQVAAPLPNLARLLALFRANTDTMRVLLISHGRAAGAVLHDLRHRPPSEAAPDPVALMRKLETDTDGALRMADFLPLSACHVLEPFLCLLGFGRFAARPSPLCGYIAGLVNSATHRSTPLGRLVDLRRLYDALVPLSAEAGAAGGVGLSLGRRLQRAVEGCLRPGVRLPEGLVSLRFPGGCPTAVVNETGLLRSQAVVIHTLMDIGTVDLQRRARCCMCSCNVPEEEAGGEGDAGRFRFGTARAFGGSPAATAQLTADCTLGCV